MIAMFCIMLIITISVVFRAFSNPLEGQVEIVRLLMLILIMAGLSYTQFQDAHVEVGLIIDRFPIRIRAIFDILAYSLIIASSFIISFYNIQGFFRYIEIGYKSEVLSIPLFPFKLIVAIGLFMWGGEALLKLIKSIFVLRNGESSSQKKVS